MTKATIAEMTIRKTAWPMRLSSQMPSPAMAAQPSTVSATRKRRSQTSLEAGGVRVGGVGGGVSRGTVVDVVAMGALPSQLLSRLDGILHDPSRLCALLGVILPHTPCAGDGALIYQYT